MPAERSRQQAGAKGEPENVTLSSCKERGARSPEQSRAGGDLQRAVQGPERCLGLFSRII